MLLNQFTIVAHFLILLIGAGVDTQQLTSSPVLALVFVLLSAVVLLPALRLLARSVARRLSPVAHGPLPRRPAAPRGVRTPADPGTPGSARPRAPSLGVHASA